MCGSGTTTTTMLPDVCGSSLLLTLPDDVFALDVIEWRKGVCSYKALCHFLVSIKPLLGIWVHQNPELGNVVYVMPGFISAVGCRIIPQELGPLGLEDSPILWSPVFEVVSDFEGSAAFFLHGRENGTDYVYPGLLKKVERTCNVLLLEVEPQQYTSEGKLFHSKSFIHPSENEASQICRSNSGVSLSKRVTGPHATTVPFGRLAFVDRRKLLDTVTKQVRQTLPDAKDAMLFPHLRREEADLRENMKLLYERRLLFIQMYDGGGGFTVWKAGSELPLHPSHVGLSEFRQNLDLISGCHSSQTATDHESRSRKTLAEYVRHSLKYILKKSNSINGKRDLLRKNSSRHGSKHAQLHEFLQPGDAIGLTLHASTVKLSSYRAWPNMHESKFALYKLPMRAPEVGQEYAGVWGGTFGWPPGRPSDDKPGKALFLLLLSYEESQGQKLLIATKILEGTHYVLHPNGSAMFIVNIEEPSNDPFPWCTDEHDSNPLYVKHAFMGEGIANGYGFRYPGSKPGSLFVIHDKMLAFIWKESRAVLALQRLDLQEVLSKGERIPALPPVSNFAYLTRSYSNVFANGLTSPRQNHPQG
ncbi:F-box protein At5g39450-like isoform X2 [Solanum dulcamara]|uniref:F-box protein At5g39450-like isoform X2 n=1 Tax=Solanum dulcamara TaxID=45834 RepID=UPI0024851990|nr:F-box protein At5g39450-like isoform X2 [Solanum dulcamara]